MGRSIHKIFKCGAYPHGIRGYMDIFYIALQSFPALIAATVIYGVIILLDMMGRIDISRLPLMLFFHLTLPIILVQATLFITDAKGAEMLFGVPVAILLFCYPFFRLNRTPCRHEQFNDDEKCGIVGIRRLIICGIVNIAVYTGYIFLHFSLNTGETTAQIINGDILFIAIGYISLTNGCLRAAERRLQKPEFLSKPRHYSLTKEQMSEAVSYYLKRTGQVLLSALPAVNIFTGIYRLANVNKKDFE